MNEHYYNIILACLDELHKQAIRKETKADIANAKAWLMEYVEQKEEPNEQRPDNA